MIKIAVCDDDADFIDNIMKPMLKEAVNQTGTQADITYCTVGTELLNSFRTGNAYDLVILDIDMPTINGKELANKLREIDSNFCLAFMTAYREEVYSVIPIGISAFIPKDFDRNKCFDSIKELLSSYEKRNINYNYFDVLINGVKCTRKFSDENIYYFSANAGLITLHTASEKYILTERIFNNITKKYTTRGFYRAHRNVLVNINKIYDVTDKTVILDNKESVPVSKRNKKDLLKELAGSVAAKVRKL